VSLIEGLEDWAVKKVIDQVLASYIAKREIAASEKPVIERAAIDIANALIAEMAHKVGAIDPSAAPR